MDSLPSRALAIMIEYEPTALWLLALQSEEENEIDEEVYTLPREDDALFDAVGCLERKKATQITLDTLLLAVSSRTSLSNSGLWKIIYLVTPLIQSEEADVKGWSSVLAHFKPLCLGDGVEAALARRIVGLTRDALGEGT